MKKVLAFFLTLLMLAAIPLSANAADIDNNRVTVIVDGEAYSAHVGDVLCYTYYLNLSGLTLGRTNCFTELEGEVLYQNSGLKLLTPLEDEDGNYPPLPYLKSGSIVVAAYPGEPIRYNALNLNGYSFKRDKILLELEFEITGKEDLYITNNILNMGSDGTKLYYLGEMFVKPKTGALVALRSDYDPYSELPGDVDMDGKILIMDATELQLWIASTKELNDQAILNGDLNRDGTADITDVTAIQRKLAGLDYHTYAYTNP